MSIFKRVLDDLDAVEQEILGPDYSYWNNINSPDSNEMDIKVGGDWDTLKNDAKGVFDYIKILISGRGKASKNDGQPLGDAFFLDTGATCNPGTLDNKGNFVANNKTDVSNNDVSNNDDTVPRSIYINNIPDGSIPFVSEMANIKFDSLEGLIPGLLSNIDHIKPYKFFQAFFLGSNPDCIEVNMKTNDVNNKKENKKKWVANVDVQDFNPCWFADNINPMTKKSCKQGFQNRIEKQFEKKFNKSQLPDDMIAKTYYTLLSVLFMYLLYKITIKKK